MDLKSQEIVPFLAKRVYRKFLQMAHIVIKTLQNHFYNLIEYMYGYML
jgi:hypothetical protein